MNTARAKLQITYQKKDITEALDKYILGWTYTDNLTGQADDLQITLEDTAQLWLGPWMPEKGASINAKIVRQNWDKEGATDTLPAGLFEIDEIEMTLVPSVVTIKALSVPQSKSLRGQQKNRAWENTKLSVIARDIAKKSGLKLIYDVTDDPEYDRVEQSGETDLEFLSRLCNDEALALKVTGTSIAIIDEQKYEKKAPIATIRRRKTVRYDADLRKNVTEYGPPEVVFGNTVSKTGVKNISARTTMQGVYRSCRIEYQNSKTKKKIQHTFTPPNPPKTDRVLFVNERVSSAGEAVRLAKKKLRQANKESVTVSMTLTGDTHFVAGVTVMLQGFGAFDGKYLVTKATHSQSSGYETMVEMRRCLEGY